MHAPFEIRPAQPSDVAAIWGADPVARDQEDRRRFIEDRVASGEAWVAVGQGALLGYVVLEHGFFGHGFIAMLVVDPAGRRAGVGSALIRHAETQCRSARVFTSTNASNGPMQALLAKLGYVRSGVVDDLDPGDPELIYSRPLVRT
jgi:ribosomal protein S18 acetylase RimI-like enzyme